MRKIIFMVIGFYYLNSCLSCQSVHHIPYNENSIRKVESSLAPSIILSGEGFDSTLWEIEERMAFYNVSAVGIAFFNQGEIQWSNSYGTLSNTDSTRISEKTMFQAASISKPVTAIGILKLVENGQIQLDTPVNDYLIGWKIPDNRHTQNRPVTIRDLLSHTSGMTVTGFDGYQAGEVIPELTDILNGVSPANSKRIEVDTVPGRVFSYSGGGYTILQKLIQDVTGSSFKNYMYENVLKPIGMKNSFFEQPLPNRFIVNAAIGHTGSGEIIPGKYHTYPELAAAGLWTTPEDLARFAMTIQKAYQGSNTEIINSHLAGEFLENQMNNWGLGIILMDGDSTKWFTHGGANFGFRCTMLTRLNDGQGVVIMTNGNRGARLYNEILRSFSTVYGWDIFIPKIKNIVRIPKEKLERLDGIYGHLPENKYQVKIKTLEHVLEATQLWNDIHFPIYPLNPYDFIEGEEGVSFDFKKDEKGRVNQLVINGDWILTRID